MLVGYRQVKGRRAFAERVRPVWVPGFSRGALHDKREVIPSQVPQQFRILTQIRKAPAAAF